jgi:hypothetical protein
MAKVQILKHMMPNDIPVFASYLYTPEGQSYTAWEFDVLIGAPADPGAHMPDGARKQALYLNSLKIDAVAWLYETPMLIEFKPEAGLGALGQVLGYQRWYELIFGKKPATMICCSRMSDQVQTLCLLEDIKVRILQPANEYQVMRAIEMVRPLIQNKSILPEMGAVS